MEAPTKEWDEPQAPPVATEAGGDDVAVAAAPAAEPPPSPEPDALDKLLNDYDQGTGNGTGNGAAADLTSDYSDDELALLLGETNRDAAARQQYEQELAAAQRYANDSAQSAMAIAQRDRQVAELRGTVEQLQQTIAAEQARQFQARQMEDFKRLAADEQSKLSDVPDVADNHVETFLLAEAARDPELARAFDARYYSPPDPLHRAQLERAIMMRGEDMARAALQIADPQQRRLAEQHIHAELRRLYANTFPDVREYRTAGAAYVRKAIDRMHREARRPRVDQSVTGDVMAVIQAVRGGASGKPPPEPPVNLGRLSEGEFRKHTMEKYGF